MTNEFELSRRKILGSAGIIGAAAAGAGFGTSAYFSDREVFEDNTITAGELDLRIDWQQLYWGPSEEMDRYDSYGPAGRPFVNAHPDHNMSGEQSLEIGGETYEYSDNDANIKEVLDCETLENFDEMSFDTADWEQDSLIELEDVKPGDCGEVTFSLHLCDNPGYIWWIGEGTGYDKPLAEKITVRAWYDIECTNEFDDEDGDQILVESTDLKTFLDDRLTPNGRFLNPNVYGEGVAGDSQDDGDSSGGFTCEPLGKINWASDGVASVEDGSVDAVRTDPLEYDIRFVAPDGYEMVVEFSELIVKDEDNNEVQAMNEQDFDINEIVEYDWKIVEDPDDTGMCRKTIKAGPDEETFDLASPGCTKEQTNIRTISENSGIPRGISFIEFEYCAPEADDPPGECFPEDETFCVSFEWCLPTNVGNEVQGDSISFDLGFYTEQCRHNSVPSGPSGFS